VDYALRALPLPKNKCFFGCASDVRYGSLADISGPCGHVGFTPDNDQKSGHRLCRLCANSRLKHRSKFGEGAYAFNTHIAIFGAERPRPIGFAMSVSGCRFAEKCLILLPLARRIIDCQNEHVVFAKITQRVFLACAYLTHGTTPDWGGAAIDCDVTCAA
jgi:hypothetical protein